MFKLSADEQLPGLCYVIMTFIQLLIYGDIP